MDNMKLVLTILGIICGVAAAFWENPNSPRIAGVGVVFLGFATLVPGNA